MIVWIANLAVIAILAALYYFGNWIGWEACLAFIVGYLWCYTQFKCWRFDYEDPPLIEEPDPVLTEIIKAQSQQEQSKSPQPPSQRH